MPPPVEGLPGHSGSGPAAGSGGSTRSTPRLLLLLAGLFLAARLILAFVDPPPADEGVPGAGGAAGGETAGPELVRWVGADSAEAEAARLGRPILYDFAAEWCGPCKAMKSELFKDAEAAQFINDTFVPARVIDRAVEAGANPPAIAALQKQYGIKAFPTLVVAGARGEPTILQGYAGRAETLKQLKAAAAAGR